MTDNSNSYNVGVNDGEADEFSDTSSEVVPSGFRLTPTDHTIFVALVKIEIWSAAGVYKENNIDCYAFCQCKLGDQFVKTQKVPGNPDPNWKGERLVLPWNGENNLRIELYSEKRPKKGDTSMFTDGDSGREERLIGFRDVNLMLMEHQVPQTWDSKLRPTKSKHCQIKYCVTVHFMEGNK